MLSNTLRNDLIIEMNQAETRACESIFSKLLAIPISRVLWEYKPELSNETERLFFYLDTIAKRLNQNMYNSPQNFVDDVNTLLGNAKVAGKKKGIYYIASEILSSRLQLLIDQESFENSDLECQSKEVENHFNNCTELLENYTEATNDEMSIRNKPQAHILTKDPKTFTSEDLSALISLCNDPIIIMKVAKFAKQMKPEIITLGEQDLSFHFCLMDDEIIQKIASFAQEEIKKSL